MTMVVFEAKFYGNYGRFWDEFSLEINLKIATIYDHLPQISPENDNFGDGRWLLNLPT